MNIFVYVVIYFLLLAAPVLSKKLNVLLLILDDLRPALGCYGDQNAYTPNIDKLASRSLLFKNTFAQQALCAPSRNSFLTSRRPDTLKLYDFYSYWREVAGNFTTLPQYFTENGFTTMSIGKVFHPGISSNGTDDQPYSWSEVPYHPPTEVYKEARVCTSLRDPFLHRNIVCPVLVREQPGASLPDIQSTDKAVQFIQKRRGSEKPFFLAVGYHKPHIPLKYPRSFKKYHPLEKVVLPNVRRKPSGLPAVAWNSWTDLRERDDIKELNVSFPFGIIQDEQAKLIKQSYYAAVSYVDALIGRIMTVLTLTAQINNTIIALIGDHGWALGENGEWSKFSNFEVALKVPFVLHIPNLTNTNEKEKVTKDLVELVDLFPTLVDLVGLPPLPPCPKPSGHVQLCTEGKSLVPYMSTDPFKSVNPTEMVALSQYPRPGLVPTLHPNSDKPRLRDIKIMGCTIRTNRYRYTEWLPFVNFTIIWDDVKATELYDHFTDPEESVNLSLNVQFIKIKKILLQKMRQHWV